MFSTKSSLESNISIPVTESNQIRLYNYKNTDLIDVDEYIVMVYDGYSDESGSGVVSYTNSSGSLGSSLTGLDSSFSYTKYRQGWIKLFDGSSFYSCEVIQYTTGTFISNTVISVLKILQKELDESNVDVVYNFVNSTGLTGYRNNVSCDINLNSVSETNQTISSLSTPIDVNASWLVTSQNLVEENPLYMVLMVGSSEGGDNILRVTEGVSVSSLIEINETITSQDLTNYVPYNGDVYVRIEITDTVPI